MHSKRHTLSLTWLDQNECTATAAVAAPPPAMAIASCKPVDLQILIAFIARRGLHFKLSASSLWTI